MEVVEGLTGRRQGRLQVCVILTTLPFFCKGVGKCLSNEGILSKLKFLVKCVREG